MTTHPQVHSFTSFPSPSAAETGPWRERVGGLGLGGGRCKPMGSSPIKDLTSPAASTKVTGGWEGGRTGPTLDIKIITEDNTIRLQGSAPSGGGRGERLGLIPFLFINTDNSPRCHSEIKEASLKWSSQERVGLTITFQISNKRTIQRGQKANTTWRRGGHKGAKNLFPLSKT